MQIKLQSAEDMLEEFRRKKWVEGDGGEAGMLRKEIAALKDELAKRLKVEKRFDVIITEKDTQI